MNCDARESPQWCENSLVHSNQTSGSFGLTIVSEAMCTIFILLGREGKEEGKGGEGGGVGGERKEGRGGRRMPLCVYADTVIMQLWPHNIMYFLLPFIFTTSRHTFIPTYS